MKSESWIWYQGHANDFQQRHHYMAERTAIDSTQFLEYSNPVTKISPRTRGRMAGDVCPTTLTSGSEPVNRRNQGYVPTPSV
jgi:hypothetical protein